MQVSDDVWSLILVHHGPLRLLRDVATREAVAAGRLQRAWRAVHPQVGDAVRVRLERRQWTEGVVVHVNNYGRRGCSTVQLRHQGRCRYVFLLRPSGRNVQRV